MENCNLENVRQQLSAFLADLREKRANPYRGTALEALTEEVRELRETHKLSYRQIAEKLASLHVGTSETEVSDFCRRAFKRRPKRASARAKPPASR